MFMRILLRALLITLIALPLTAGTPQVPRQLANARFVALGFETGAGFVSEYDLQRVASIPEDRRALERVRTALRNWGKYSVTTEESADLLIGLRAGRAAGTNAGGGASGGTNQTPSGAVIVGADLGPQADLLAIYSADHISGPGMDASSEAKTADPGPNASPFGAGRTRQGSLLWRASGVDGLQGSLPIVERLRADIASIPDKKKKK
jgi:hypothetical protein